MTAPNRCAFPFVSGFRQVDPHGTNPSDHAKPFSHNCADKSFHLTAALFVCMFLVWVVLLGLLFGLLMFLLLVSLLCTGPPSARPLVAHLLNEDYEFHAKIMQTCCMQA